MDKEQKKQIQDVIEILDELQEDLTVPKNVKIKLVNAAKALKGEAEPSISINKALNELEGITDDANMQSYTRTQIWNVVSLLEKI